MRIRCITPIRVDDAEVARRQERYNRLAPAGWHVTLENLPEGAPAELGVPGDVRASEKLLLELGAATSPDDFDAFMPDCVLDPSVAELDAAASVTVLGISRLSAHHLAACGHTFGVITRNRTIGDEFSEMIVRYGLDHAYRGAFVLDLGVEAVSDHDAWNAAVRTQAERAREAGVTTLINGCSAVDVATEGTGVRLVDPIELAFEVAALGERAHLLP